MNHDAILIEQCHTDIIIIYFTLSTIVLNWNYIGLEFFSFMLITTEAILDTYKHLMM